jgi:HD-like signal output (HDOD) protein
MSAHVRKRIEEEPIMYQWLRRLISGPAAPARQAPTTHAPAGVRAPGAAPSPDPLPPAPDVPAAAPAPSPSAAMPAGEARSNRPPVPFEQLDLVGTAWNAWLFERADEGGLELNAYEAQVLETLAAILSSQQSGAALVRRMPGLIPQLLQSLRSETFSGSALSRTISSDVVLVAAVIRLANSCYQTTGASVTSVEQAVILIGQEGLRQLITTVAFRPIIDVHSGYYVRRLAPILWEHSERCAIAARKMAPPLGIEPFDAFLAALLQNVGLTVALRSMDQVTKGEPQLGAGVFWAQLARDTRRLSVSIAREWNFPESVVRALDEQGGMRKGAVMSPLGRLLMLVDYLGKLRVLVEQGVLEDGDSRLFAGLPGDAGECYELLS